MTYIRTEHFYLGEGDDYQMWADQFGIEADSWDDVIVFISKIPSDELADYGIESGYTTDAMEP